MAPKVAQPSGKDHRALGVWLLLCAAVIYAMIVLGGVTRLTQSGLSIVDWKPVSGVLPPLGEAGWLAEFERYKAFPEYQRVNLGMALADFKRIFYFEYAHRLLGRFIGILFLVPLLYFSIRRRIPAGLTPKLILLFVLGGLQGVLGWYMVKSGLVDEPRVSQYRLAAHMGLAVLIYGYMLWLALAVLASPERAALSEGRARGFRWALGLTALVFTMILSGAFVAGTHAGVAYSTFPLMAGAWVPDGLFVLEPYWRNFFENITTVQFAHRVIALVVTAYVVGLSALLLRDPPSRRVRASVGLLLVALTAQVSLGIATLLLKVPITLAALHQGGAILLLSAALVLAHCLRFSEPSGRLGSR